MSRKKILRIILFLVLCFSVCGIAFLSIFLMKATQPKAINTITDSGIDVFGEWFGGPNNQDILVFSKDGRYESSTWLVSGTYSICNEEIHMVDPYGATKTFVVNLDQLCYSTDGDDYSYDRTREDGSAEDAASDLNSLYTAAVTQILTGGHWANAKGDPLIISEYTILFLGNEYSYCIESVAAKNGVYLATAVCDGNNVQIQIEETDSRYHLKLVPIFADEFTALADIRLLQP